MPYPKEDFLVMLENAPDVLPLKDLKNSAQFLIQNYCPNISAAP